MNKTENQNQNDLMRKMLRFPKNVHGIFFFTNASWGFYGIRPGSLQNIHLGLLQDFFQELSLRFLYEYLLEFIQALLWVFLQGFLEEDHLKSHQELL